MRKTSVDVVGKIYFKIQWDSLLNYSNMIGHFNYSETGTIFDNIIIYRLKYWEATQSREEKIQSLLST